MTPPTNGDGPSFRRINAHELDGLLGSQRPPLLLDVRRGAAFEEHPGIPTALPLALDRDPMLLPDISRGRPLVVYCL